MCGRYQITSPMEAITNLIGNLETSLYQNKLPEGLHANSDAPVWPEIYNAAPTMSLPVIYRSSKTGPNSGFTMEPMHWGLIPSWAKDRKFAAKTINARIETAHEKPSFKSAYSHRRALVPATAYFEWQTIAGQKQPFRFHLAGNKPFLMAGIWENWQDEGGQDFKSFSLLTMESEDWDNIARIHHRMPFLINPGNAEMWINGQLQISNIGRKSAVLRNDALYSHPVSRDLNKVVNQNAVLVEPIELLIQLESSNARLKSNNAVSDDQPEVIDKNACQQGDLFS